MKTNLKKVKKEHPTDKGYYKEVYVLSSYGRMYLNQIKERTETERRIGQFLETLVGQRFTKETLENYIENKLGYKVSLEDISKDDDELSDFNLLGGLDNKATKVYGFIDIHFLKMRNNGFDGANIYITEVSYEFE